MSKSDGQPRVTKSEIVRLALRNNPDLGPTEIMQLVISKHPEITKLSVQEVSTIKARLKKDAAGEASSSPMETPRGSSTPIAALAASPTPPKPTGRPRAAVAAPKTVTKLLSISDAVLAVQELSRQLGKEEAKRLLDLVG